MLRNARESLLRQCTIPRQARAPAGWMQAMAATPCQSMPKIQIRLDDISVLDLHSILHFSHGDTSLTQLFAPPKTAYRHRFVHYGWLSGWPRLSRSACRADSTNKGVLLLSIPLFACSGLYLTGGDPLAPRRRTYPAACSGNVSSLSAARSPRADWRGWLLPLRCRRVAMTGFGRGGVR
jgi:hypothetical protein